jgi:hypothetical protein
MPPLLRVVGDQKRRQSTVPTPGDGSVRGVLESQAAGKTHRPWGVSHVGAWSGWSLGEF